MLSLEKVLFAVTGRALNYRKTGWESKITTTKYLAKDDAAGTHTAWINSIVVQRLGEHHIVSYHKPCFIIIGHRCSDNDFSWIANRGCLNIHLAMSENWLRQP